MPHSAVLFLPSWKHTHPETELRPAIALIPPPSLEDMHLGECVKRALRATGYGALRDIKVAVSARMVQLAGRVPSYYLKQIAQETARAIPGTHRIHNVLEVLPAS